MSRFTPRVKSGCETKASSASNHGKAFFSDKHAAHSIVGKRRTPGKRVDRQLTQTNNDVDAVTFAGSTQSRAAYDFGRIPIHSKTAVKYRPKLTVNAPGDIYEQEADRIADLVTALPDRRLMRSDPCGGGWAERQTGQPGQEQILIRTKHASTDSSRQTTAPAIVQNVLYSPGRPLDTETRATTEAQLGHDFSRVRIHTGAKDDQSARAVNAHAFTVKNHIFFRENQYRPNTSAGRRLLVHELVHVLQSNDSDTTIHRAEVEDKDAVCKGLTDIKPDVNRFVNGVLASARSSPGVSPLPAFLGKVLVETGGKGAVGPVEDFVEHLPASKRFLPSKSLKGTRYASLPSASGLGIPSIGGRNIYDLHKAGFAHVVGATALINGICAGADKLGHFFQQGAQYLVVKDRSSVADAESFGRATEIDRAGLGATGVYSNADLAANKDGLRFWEQLAADPAGLSFEIADYITNSWNEYSNPNYYEPSIAREVWAAQLTGNWKGKLGLGSTLREVEATLSATKTGKVTGTFKAVKSSAAPAMTGTIDGKITYQKTSVSGTISSSVLHGGSGTHTADPVSGIMIEFDWASGGNRGKGKWESIGEEMLIGDFGDGSSRTSRGVFNIVRR